MKRSSIKRRESVEQQEEKYVIRRLSTFKIEEKNGWWGVFTEEILPRLPADHLEILKTVCKNWSRTISSPYFVRLHLNNVYNQGQIRVLKIPRWNSAVNMTEYNIKGNDVCKRVSKFPFPVPICKRVSKILGSCDGLLCLFLRKPNQFGVYNPSTAKYFLVQEDNNNYTIEHSWFGHHPSSGEYILVLVFRDDLDWKVGVYKFSGGSEFTLEPIQSTTCLITPAYYSSFHKRITLLHGTLHWSVFRVHSQDNHRLRHVICTYNLDHNKCSEISLPGPVQGRLKLGVNAEGCLFAISNSGNDELMEMWVMKEYGVEQSWAKHANIVGPYENSVLSPLGLFPNGDLILDANRLGLFKYNFNDNKIVRLIKYHNIKYHVYSGPDTIVCVDSLVCPTIVLS